MYKADVRFETNFAVFIRIKNIIGLGDNFTDFSEKTPGERNITVFIGHCEKLCVSAKVLRYSVKARRYPVKDFIKATFVSRACSLFH